MNKRRTYVRWTLFVLVSVNLALMAAWSIYVPRPPHNVLIITIDTWRFDTLRTFGGKAVMPNLETLATRGIAFERAYAQGDQTPGSHLSLFSSRYIDFTNKNYEFPLLAQVFKASGFNTAAVVSTSLIDRDVPQTDAATPVTLGLGFDSFSSVQEGPPAAFGAAPLRRKGEETNQIALKRLRLLIDGKQPWMMWVHYYDLHQPIVLPDAWPRHPDALSFDMYLEAAAYVDSLCGQIFKELRAHNVDDNTVIVVTGDHGEAFGEHGIMRSHFGLYNVITHVPMVAWFPHAPHGVRVAAVVQNLDIAPSVLRAANITVPPTMQGTSLTARARTAEPGLAFAASVGGASHMTTDGRWKYIDYDFDLRVPAEWVAGAHAGGPPKAVQTGVPPEDVLYRKAGENEVFRLDSDPQEAHNLWARRPDVVTRMASWLQAQRGDGHAPAVDPELQQRLKALGY